MVGSVAACALCMQRLPERMWGLLVVVSTPALLAVQLPQIWKNWHQKHTGELATLTVLLACLGSSVRVGTTIAVSHGGGQASRPRLTFCGALGPFLCGDRVFPRNECCRGSERERGGPGCRHS